MTHHLVGAAEIAELLGVSRQRVNQLVRTYLDFPEPEAELAAGRVWSGEEVRDWVARHPERKVGRAEGRTIMFERFTERARKVFALAQGEAGARNHNYVGCEHLVLGLLLESEGIAGRAFEALGLDADKAGGSLSRILRSGAKRPDAPSLPFTLRVKRAIELAEEASLEFGHNYLGTEHLLLGILREEENVGCRLIVEAGLDLTNVRLKVLELMGFPQPRSPGNAGESSETASLLENVVERLERIEQLLERQIA